MTDRHGCRCLPSALIALALSAVGGPALAEAARRTEPELAERQPASEGEAADQPDRRGSRWHLGLEAVTDLPLDVAGRIGLELPYGFRLGTSLGVLPQGYVDVINAAVVSTGSYDQGTADLVSEVLRNSLVFRVHVGWRPPRGRGFYLDVGYGMVSVDRDLDAAAMVTAATGQALPPGLPAGLAFGLRSTLHMVDVELGWELVFARHFVLRFAVGAALTVGSETTVTPGAELRGYQEVQAAAAEAGRTLDEDILQRYVFLPTFSCALGYRFF